MFIVFIHISRVFNRKITNNPKSTMLKGMVSIVTGGSSGLGRATVERLVANGGRVLVCDIQSTKGQQFIKELNNKDAIFAKCDICSEEDVKSALDTAMKQFHRVDIVVNCAGIATAYKTYNFLKMRPHELEDFTKTIQVNTIGTFNMIRLSAGVIGQNAPNSDGQRGLIINTACTSAYDGQMGQAAYAASKAAIVGMTLPIARDFASQGIRVVTIAPGLFDTPLLQYIPEKVRRYLERMVPFPPRLGRPNEFAQLVTSVIENPMLNGEVIRLDGAYRMFPL